MNEIWVSPEGLACELHYVPFQPSTDDPDWEPWYPDEPGQRPPAHYELRSTFSGDVAKCLTVFPVEPWSPYDAVSDQLVRNGWHPPPLTPEELAECPHGLSAQLCADPINHYPREEGW